MRQRLRQGDPEGALAALRGARDLRNRTEPPLISARDLDMLQSMIETVPAAAVQVLKHAPSRPFAALGVERLAGAKGLNAANRKELIKKYRRLALELHPDRCDHEMANDAMQALNVAYDKITIPPKPKTQAAYGARGRPGPRRR